MAEKTAEKPKIIKKEYEFDLNDSETALILAINDLQIAIKGLTK